LPNEYNYGQKGVGTDIQFGKRGPRLVANASTTALQVTAADGSTLNNVRIADGVISSDAVTKSQLDTAVANAQGNAYNITLGSGGDGSFVSPGAVGTLDANTSVSQAIDDLNEAMLNVQNNTFVKEVDFTSNVVEGGNPLSVTLSTTVTGSANRYTIDWGDGDTTTATTDSTPSHTYTDNTNSPFDITVTAFNSNGSGAGSTASKTRTEYVTLYTATPVTNFDLYTVASGGTILSGNSREIDEGETIYLDNTTTNSGSATCTYTVDWGDGSSTQTIASGASGDVGQARLSHTYTADSGTSMYTITLTQTAHSTASPTDIPNNTTESLKVYDPAISAPNGLSSKTISFAESSSGTNPRAANNFTDNISGGGTYTAGSSVTRITNSSAGTNTSTGTLSTFTYNGDAGSLTAQIDNGDGGSIAKSVASDVGTSSGITITAESDFQFLSASGSSTSFTNSIYSPGLYQGFKAKIEKQTVGLATGVHSYQMKDSATGDTNTLIFIKDDLESTPTVTMSNANLVQGTAGTLKYVSGIPYYTDDATLNLTGVEVYDWIGQTYTNSSSPLTITNGTNQESTTGTTVSSQGYSYADIDGSSTFLNSGIPIADTGKTSATAYTLGTIVVDVDGNGTGIEQIKGRMLNVNGNSPYTELTGKYVQAWNNTSGIDEEQITVSDSLGAGFNDDGKRITGFSDNANTPTFDSSVNNYTANAWTGSQTIAGTVEAVDRFGTIKHFDTDLSGTAYLPTGPDLNTGRSGAQYFTFAFRRTTMASFDITLTGKVSGVFIAAPGTNIDSASGLNGWLDASITYGGSGTPGSDTGAGGNGSNGCAFTSGDKIIDGTTYSNSSFTMTLGDQNASDATGNNILIRIKLESGDSLTALSIS
jgi:hypothetical protein